MSLSAKQIAALNGWSTTQEFGANGQVDGNPANDINALGTLLDNGKVLSDNLRDEYINMTVSPAGNATTDYVAFTAPMAGTLQSVQIVSPSNWSTTTTASDGYTVAVRKYNTGVTANLTVAYGLKTGLAGGVIAVLPTNASNTALAMLTVTSTTVGLAASSLNITVTSTGAFVNAPAVNDYVVILEGATSFTGATYQNTGIYLVTSVDPANLWYKATKQFGANAQTVAAVAVLAGDVTGMLLVKQGFATVAAGDMLGFEFISTTAVACPPLSLQIRFRPS